MAEENLTLHKTLTQSVIYFDFKTNPLQTHVYLQFVSPLVEFMYFMLKYLIFQETQCHVEAEATWQLKLQSPGWQRWQGCQAWR